MRMRGAALDRLVSFNPRGIYAAVSAGLTAILLVLWLLEWFVSPTTLAAPISIIILLGLLPNLALAVWSTNDPPIALVAFSFVADITGVTAGIHFGGGVDQVSAPLLYAIIIGLAGLLVSGRAAFLAAAGGGLEYALLVWTEFEGFLPHRVSYSRPPDRQAATVIMVNLNLFLFAWLVSYVARQISVRYERAEALRGEAVSALSHDIKSPLNTIYGYAQMVEAAPPSERADYLEGIQRSTQQVLDLVSNVLDAAAIEGRPMTAQPLPVRLNELLAEIVDQYRFAANGKGVRLATQLAPDLPVVQADAQLLRRAIANLLSNAIKFTTHNGRVEVTSQLGGDGVSVTVSDSGCGIAPNEQGQLFQRYSRPASSRTTEGTGLGLYIVRCVAEAHGGSVRVDSVVGRGSTFTLQLPLKTAALVNNRS